MGFNRAGLQLHFNFHFNFPSTSTSRSWSSRGPAVRHRALQGKWGLYLSRKLDILEIHCPTGWRACSICASGSPLLEVQVAAPGTWARIQGWSLATGAYECHGGSGGGGLGELISKAPSLARPWSQSPARRPARAGQLSGCTWQAGGVRASMSAACRARQPTLLQLPTPASGFEGFVITALDGLGF